MPQTSRPTSNGGNALANAERNGASVITFGPRFETMAGDVRRFPDAAHLAAYAGTTPRVAASGGKVRFGRLRPDVNHYLKWAYAEAANVICGHRAHWPHRHVTQLYGRFASARTTPKPSVQWRGIWRRPRIGS
jgi:hypothetical protein